MLNRVSPGVSFCYYLLARANLRPSAFIGGFSRLQERYPPIRVSQTHLRRLRKTWLDWTLKTAKRMPDDPARAVTLLKQMCHTRLPWADDLLQQFRTDWQTLFWKTVKALERIDLAGLIAQDRQLTGLAQRLSETVWFYHFLDCDSCQSSGNRFIVSVRYLKDKRRFAALLRQKLGSFSAKPSGFPN